MRKSVVVVIAAVTLLFVACGVPVNPFLAKDSQEKKENKGKKEKEIDNGEKVSYAIKIDMKNNQGADTVTANPDHGYAGASITLHYTVANIKRYNLLDFEGVDTLEPVTEAGSGTLTYTVNASDATEEGEIIIIAAFEHTDLELDPIAFTDTSSHITKTYGDEPFTNAIKSTYQGSGAITYSSEHTDVATVDNNGVVIIHKAGSTIITAEKDADERYAHASHSYTLEVDRKMLTLSVPNGTTLTPLEGENSVTVTITGLVADDSVPALSVPTGFTFDSTARTLTYEGTAFPTTSATINFAIPAGSNYTTSSSSTITVYDGLEDFDGTGVDRRIPVTQDNVLVFNTYANTTGVDRHYKQTTDITLTQPAEGESNWTAIGVSYPPANQFTGSFDGSSHTITGMVINRTTVSYQGMFGYSTGTLRNIGLLHNDITGNSGVGGVVGSNDYGTVTNCYATGDVSGSYNVGGVVGGSNNGTVTNCYATGSVSGSSTIGGVVGFNNRGTVSDCYAIGSVSGSSGDVGGVVGTNYDGTVSDCYATGDVSSSGTSSTYVGGVVGTNYGNQNGSITVSNCYATGDINSSSTSSASVGGVVGFINGFPNGSITVSNCYATGSVSSSGTSSTYVGGVVGDINGNQNGSITVSNCYATGDVSGSYNVGGVVGFINSNPNGSITVSNCYTTSSVINNNSNGSVYGVVGRGNGTIQNCVALNEKIITTGTSPGYVVLVGGTSGTINNNYARRDMVAKYNWDGITGMDTPTFPQGLNTRYGADVTAEQYNSENWWKTASNWSTANDITVWDFDTVWEWDSDRNLPKLRNMPE